MFHCLSVQGKTTTLSNWLMMPRPTWHMYRVQYVYSMQFILSLWPNDDEAGSNKAI